MPNFNQLTMAGHLTRKPELRFTNGKGTAICSSGIAVNRFWTDVEGEKKEDVCFIEFTLFGKGAETFVKHTDKGSPVLLSGYLKLEKWEKDGEPQSRHQMIVETFNFLGYKDQTAGKPPAAAGKIPPGKKAAAAAAT